MTERTIDINADAGESFGPWPMGSDAELFPYLSSVNLACGFHAGDPLIMRSSVALAARHGLAIGAHPGFRDLAGFGRRDLAVTPDEIAADVIYQIGALDAFVRPLGLTLHHVKPHGALYLRMCRDEAIARAVAEAVKSYEAGLPLVVLHGTVMQRAAVEAGLRVAVEAFPDRAYMPDGGLAPRSRPDAVIHDPAQVAERGVAMVLEGRVVAVDGTSVPVAPETLCLHGDNPAAAENARALRQALEAAGVTVRAF
jgi:5-oxoprolinase (ATP-hydrolysing) subunit A